MAIAPEKPPVESVKTLEEGLANIGVTDLSIDESFPKFNKFVDDHNDPSKLRPHQIYALRLDRLAEGGPLLEEAELLGWRYIVGGTPDSLLSADVQAGAGDEHVFSAFSQSRIANETITQLDKVIADKSFSQEKFTPRLLRVFGLMFAALWLHRPGAEDFKDDIFIPLPGASDPLTAGERYSRDDLAAALHTEAEEQIKLVTATSS
jgi:hypothetical protein